MDTSTMTVMSDTRTGTGSPRYTGPDDAADRKRTMAVRTWQRYSYARDNGHQQYVERADVCTDFFRGKQWRQEDIQELAAANRPHLTINKIKPTILTQLGEQVQNRSEISFRPKDGAAPQTADTLTKVFKHISEIQQLDWKRSDMFADGMITSRGFLDIRMSFERSMTGDVEYTLLNPKNVIVDPDAEQLDPDTWNEVFHTKWVTLDDIALLYGEDKADILRGRDGSSLAFGYDSIDRVRDRFGERFSLAYDVGRDDINVERSIRLIERQHRELTKQRHLVDLRTGDMRVIPDEWDQRRVATVAQQYGLGVVKKLVKRIKWDVIADGEVMHSEWSPYQHFTIVPFIPMFIHGHTLGAVEDLIDPQELLNKSLSGELHVVNSTANGGWKIKTGSLRNLSAEELEQKGAMTGLVMELDDIGDAEKIQPTVTPQGLDRLSFKAEEHMKTISNVSDSMQGQDREDVSGKAIQQKRQAGAASHAKPIDSLVRTDYFIARNTLDLIQEFYSEERVITITHDKVTGDTTDVPINQRQPDGTVLNDLTAGTYEVVISSVPLRETLEDSQFDQAVALRQLGVKLDDTVLIKASRLLDKNEIIKGIQAQAASPEARQQQQLQLRAMSADIDKTEAEAANFKADASLKGAKTAKDSVTAAKDAHTPIEPPQAGADPALAAADQQHRHNLEIDAQNHDQSIAERELALKQHTAEQDQQREDAEAAAKQTAERVAQAHERTKATTKPTPGA